MKIHNFDGKQYIALGDLDWLRHNLILDIRDKYECGEDGQIHMKPEDVGQISAYSHIMVEILKDRLHEADEEATDAKSMRENRDRIYDRIRSEWAKDKYVIVATDNTQSGKGVYFNRIDEKEDGKEVPAFTDIKRKAHFFENHYDATCTLNRLKKLADGMEAAISDLYVDPAWWHFTKVPERLLAAIFGDEDDGHEYCIFLEPDDSEEGKHEGMWFSQWIKYRDDLPAGIKSWLESADVEPGESVPMFTGGNAEIMRFRYKGMAEKTVEKIAEMYPQFDGKLHVMEYEEVDDDDA